MEKGKGIAWRKFPAALGRELMRFWAECLQLGRDRLALGLALAAAAALLALFIYLRAIIASLPMVLPLHFTAWGEPDRIAPREDIFRLPRIGALILVGNLLLALLLRRRQRPASLILLAAALLVQLVFWWAAINIVS